MFPWINRLPSVAGATVYGTTGNDYIYQNPTEVSAMQSFNKTLIGRAGKDFIEAGFGNDKLYGGANNDELRGGPGNDRIEGGSGVDRAQFGFAKGSYNIALIQGGITISHTAPAPPGWPVGVPYIREGKDTISFDVEYVTFNDFNGSISKVTYSTASLARLASRNTSFDSFSKADTIIGYQIREGTRSSESILGSSKDEHLRGAGGNDVLFGGDGSDLLEGGNGADTFVFRNVSNSRWDKEPDRIIDFSFSDNDKINLSRIDANTETSFDDAFQWIGRKAFSGISGELRVTASTDGLKILADLDGDKCADFAILMDNLYTIDVGQILL